MVGIDQTRLLQFARELQRAVNFTEMFEFVRDAVESMVGYRHAWMAMVEPNLTHVRILAFVGVGTSWDEALVIPIAGDASGYGTERLRSRLACNFSYVNEGLGAFGDREPASPRLRGQRRARASRPGSVWSP